MQKDKCENLDNKRYNESQDVRQKSDTCSIPKNQTKEQTPDKLSGSFIDEAPKPAEKK